MAASSDRLGGLHEMFTAYWEHRFEAAQKGIEDEEYVPLTANDLAVVRAFLKDNNVTAEPGGDKDLARLGQTLQATLKGSMSQSELDNIMQDASAWMGTQQ